VREEDANFIWVEWLPNLILDGGNGSDRGGSPSERITLREHEKEASCWAQKGKKEIRHKALLLGMPRRHHEEMCERRAMPLATICRTRVGFSVISAKI